MITRANGHHGTMMLDGIEACVSVGDVDLVITGGVLLSPVLDQNGPLDAWVTSARIDDGAAQPAWGGDVPDEAARDALYQAAVDELRRSAA